MDRNIHTQHLSVCIIESLSARRAWIEISTYVTRLPRCQVALRKESVDRNSSGVDFAEDWLNASLSARRAWIEIDDISGATNLILRSLSARRAWIEILRGQGR